MHEEYIDTIAGRAYFYKTITEDKYGNWDDHWSSLAGEFVIHEGNKHHVYIIYETINDRHMTTEKNKDVENSLCHNWWTGTIPRIDGGKPIKVYVPSKKKSRRRK